MEDLHLLLTPIDHDQWPGVNSDRQQVNLEIIDLQLVSVIQINRQVVASVDVPPTMETANLEVSGLHLVDPEIIDLQGAIMAADQILPKLLQINHSMGA